MAEIFERFQGEHYEFVDPSWDAIEYIAANLRQGDREEIFAATGTRHYLGMISASLTATDDAVVAISAWGEPLAVFGVGTLSLLYNTGIPWMLCTPKAMRHRRAFIWQARQYTGAMLKHYTRLENHVDARNRVSVAWLQHIGFKMHEPAPHGALGLPFHRFSIER